MPIPSSRFHAATESRLERATRAAWCGRSEGAPVQTHTVQPRNVAAFLVTLIGVAMAAAVAGAGAVFVLDQFATIADAIRAAL